MATATATRDGGTGSGWITFAGVVFVVAGFANLVWGLGALGKKQYLAESGVIYSTLNTWGWVAVIWGVVVLVGAVLLLGRTSAGPAVGLTLAAISCIFWFLVLPILPIFALAAIMIDVLVIYGLAAHGLPERD